jgi:hypothetical protein
MPKNTENFERGTADSSAPSNDKNHKMANLMNFGGAATVMGDIGMGRMKGGGKGMRMPPKPEAKPRAGTLTTGPGPDAKTARGGVSKGERTRRRR